MGNATVSIERIGSIWEVIIEVRNDPRTGCDYRHQPDAAFMTKEKAIAYGIDYCRIQGYTAKVVS